MNFLSSGIFVEWLWLEMAMAPFFHLSMIVNFVGNYSSRKLLSFFFQLFTCLCGKKLPIILDNKLRIVILDLI